MEYKDGPSIAQANIWNLRQMVRRPTDLEKDGYDRDYIAFEWLSRVRDEACTKAEHEEFRLWLRDSKNALAFDEAKAFKEDMDAIASRPAIAALRKSVVEKTAAKLAQRSEAEGSRQTQDSPSKNVVSLVSKSPSDVADEADSINQTKGKGFRKWATFAAGLSVAAAVAFFSFLPLLQNTHQTDVGEIRRLVLDDQTKITLDTDTKIRVAYSETERKIYLKNGQAFFDVAKNAERPFTVDTGNDEVIAVGTAFSVRKIDDDFTVVLSEGIVDVSASNTNTSQDIERVRLAPGQQWHASKGNKGSKTAVADLNAHFGWIDGTLVFRSTKLGQVLREVNRYSESKINVKDAELLDSEIDAVYHLGKTESFAVAVRKMLGLVLEYDRSGNISLEKVQP